MHGRSRKTTAIRPSHTYSAGTEHVGVSTDKSDMDGGAGHRVVRFVAEGGGC